MGSFLMGDALLTSICVYTLTCLALINYFPPIKSCRRTSTGWQRKTLHAPPGLIVYSFLAVDSMTKKFGALAKSLLIILAAPILLLFSVGTSVPAYTFLLCISCHIELPLLFCYLFSCSLSFFWGSETLLVISLFPGDI